VSDRADRLAAVRTAQQAVAAARDELQLVVDRAHSEGASWADIGAALAISRQAAFKRFGHPRDPRTGHRMTPVDPTPLVALTERVFALLDGGDHLALRELMNDRTARELTGDVVLGTWAQVVAESGNLTGCRETRLESSDGTLLNPSEATLGLVVGHTTIDCEAGEWWGRVAFDADQRISGLLVVPVDTSDLPF
jgi:hypothetical protein